MTLDLTGITNENEFYTHHYLSAILENDLKDLFKEWNRRQKEESIPTPSTLLMPVISMFYEVMILIFYFDNKKHNLPHIHAQYAEHEAIIGIKDGEIIEGSLPKPKMRLVQAWIEIHREDLMANWKMAVEGQQPFKIEPLR